MDKGNQSANEQVSSYVFRLQATFTRSRVSRLELLRLNLCITKNSEGPVVVVTLFDSPHFAVRSLPVDG